MAVQQGYGKMAGTDALVFAYDTGDAVNSYKGEPATNYLSAGLNNITAFAASAWKGATLTQVGTSVFDTPIFSYATEGTSYTYTNDNVLDDDLATLSQQTVTFSLYIRRIEGPATCQIRIYDNNSGYTYQTRSVTTQFTRIEMTKTIGTSPTRIFVMLDNTGGGTYEFHSTQLELNSKATPFVNGTRSATEGLLDLTGTTSIDLSNVSFDSDSNIDFDGTDDRIFAGNPSELSLSNGIGSIEAVVKFPRSWTGGSQYPNLICKGARAGWDTPGWSLFGFRDWPNANNKSWGLGLRNASGSIRTVAKYDIPTDVYLHLLATMDGTTMKLYENGILVSTQTQTVNPAENSYNVFIGGDDGSNRFPGDIPVVKVYNKALTDSEVLSNFKNYRNRFSDLSNYYDNSSDGGRWIRWWWYTGVGWPGHETEALGHPFGTFDSSSHYGFQRLPEGLDKEQVELLAKDGDGNIYKWDFASPSATAQQVWDSFTLGTQGIWNNTGDAWNPEVIAGSFFGTDQDAWQYRESEGVVSFLLDDDTCDCVSTLNAGHAMCGAGWNQTYAQPDGAYLRYGVDTLNDGGCRGPLPERTLELFYRLK